VAARSRATANRQSMRSAAMNRRLYFAALAIPALVAGCVSLPSGPSVTSLPGTGKSFDQFRADESECRQYASSSVGDTNPSDVQADSAAKSAVVGTAVGALAGAAIGGHNSTATGAGIGLLFGALAGADAANASGYSVQQRYDSAFLQCMYARGNKVPMAARAVRSPAPRYYAPAPPVYYNYPPPPPPPGY
jgi:outer membrane lipoprotein SlyB